jgi:hypothetical protein
MKPINFTTWEVQAAQDDRKSVFRRVVKVPDGCFFLGVYNNEIDFGVVGTSDSITIKPPYRKGDILYVKETWCPLEPYFGRAERGNYVYKANSTPDSERLRKNYGIPWRSPITMPKEVARIFYRVTRDSYPERLKDITEEQAKREGFKSNCDGDVDSFIVPKEIYRIFWDTQHKKQLDKYGWNANPWVWATEIKRISKEEAEKEEAG